MPHEGVLIGHTGDILIRHSYIHLCCCHHQKKKRILVIILLRNNRYCAHHWWHNSSFSYIYFCHSFCFDLLCCFFVIVSFAFFLKNNLKVKEWKGIYFKNSERDHIKRDGTMNIIIKEWTLYIYIYIYEQSKFLELYHLCLVLGCYMPNNIVVENKSEQEREASRRMIFVRKPLLL